MTADFKFPDILYAVFSQEKLESLPILDIGTRVGHTQYIDFIKATELTSTVMRGRDVYNRPFITLRYKYDEHQNIATIFQRYTNDPNLWVTMNGPFPGLLGVYLLNFNNLTDVNSKIILDIIDAAINGNVTYTYTVSNYSQETTQYTIVFGLGG